MNRPAAHGRRPGFTLIEMLVVITIIALLLGLLLPAINAAVKNARNAAVQAEISQIAQALADFKNKYGDYPPSRMMLCEDGFFATSNTTPVASGATADVTYGQLAQRSIAAFRKFFPRAVVSASGQVWGMSGKTGPSQWYDFNGNGTFEPSVSNSGQGYVMEGQECLVFFLGGIPFVDGSNNIVGMSGFGKTPTNPFSNNNPSFKMYNGNRTTSLYEFDNGRLVRNSSYAAGASYLGMPAYVDNLASTSPSARQNFLAYFSNNLGSGYDPNDINFGNTTPPGPTQESDNHYTAGVVNLTFQTNQPTFAPAATGGTGGPTNSTTTQSPSPNPYTTSAPAGGGAVAYYKNDSFQILSAGADGTFGVGGIYTPNAQDTLPREDGAGPTTTPAAATVAPYPYSSSLDSKLRFLEADNLTNFHVGKLQ